MENRNFVIDSRQYQTAPKTNRPQRRPLSEMKSSSNLRSSTAGKILKTSRLGKSKAEEKPISNSRVKSKHTIDKWQTLQEMERRRDSLLEEVRVLERNIKQLKETQQFKEVKYIKEPEYKVRFAQTALLKIADAGLVQYKSQTNKIPQSRILQIIDKQIFHETEFRSWKIKMPKQYQPQVFKILQQKHKIPLNDLIVEFDEFDPFIQTDTSLSKQMYVNQIYLSYAKCQEHWKNYASNKFEKEQAKIIFSKLDFDKQGTVSLKQLVREMSVLLDKNLRARDVFRIFKRIVDQGQQFTCTQFLKSLARKDRSNI